MRAGGVWANGQIVTAVIFLGMCLRPVFGVGLSDFSTSLMFIDSSRSTAVWCCDVLCLSGGDIQLNFTIEAVPLSEDSRGLSALLLRVIESGDTSLTLSLALSLQRFTRSLWACTTSVRRLCGEKLWVMTFGSPTCPPRLSPPLNLQVFLASLSLTPPQTWPLTPASAHVCKPSPSCCPSWNGEWCSPQRQEAFTPNASVRVECSGEDLMTSRRDPVRWSERANPLCCLTKTCSDSVSVSRLHCNISVFTVWHLISACIYYSDYLIHQEYKCYKVV